jgi:histidinol phosphatase-like PHP family hydrolase
MSDRQKFMDAYVDWYVRILEEQPIDVLANVSWLPELLANDYDTMWTDRRIARVLDAAKRHTVAIEISSSFRLPRLRFLRMAKEAGLKFTYGSNGRYPKMGLLEYSLVMGKELALTQTDFFIPGQINKAVERRTF